MIKLNSSLRISVVDNCNFSCLYCPREGSMENYCPKNIKSKVLNTTDFINIIDKLLSTYKFTKVVITGGEPLLCNDLENILEKLSEFDNEIELDTNGSLFNINIWNKIKKYIDGVKISLDSLNIDNYKLLTNSKNNNSIKNIKELIANAKKDNVDVTINCVCTKINFDDILQLADYCISNKLNLSLLDLYYTKETETFWKENYININEVKKIFNNKFNKFVSDDSFGCEFEKIYYNETNYIKFKSSSSATMRDDFCESCSTYCQEGIFCLRLSRQGWMTVCQSSEKEGILVDKNADITKLINRLENARPDSNSFEKMLQRNEVIYDNRGTK